MFPEGTKGTGKLYRDRYKLHRFGRGGFVEIAMRSGVPVIPIAVVGAEESMPIIFKSRRLAALLEHPVRPDHREHARCSARSGLGIYFPAKFRSACCRPVHFDVPPDQERYPRSRVMDEAEHIREQIQDALYDMLRARRSVWFGLSAVRGPRHRARHVLGQPPRAGSSRARRDVEIIVGLDTTEPPSAARTHRVRAGRLVTTRSSHRIVRATQVDTILHTHLIVDSTRAQRPGAARDQRDRDDEPARGRGRRRAAPCARSS